MLVEFLHVSVLREGLEQATQRNLLLVPKLSRECLGRQVVVEGVANVGAEESLVLVAELRIGEVESLCIRIVTAEVGKVGDIDDEFLDQIPLEGDIQAIVHGGAEIPGSATASPPRFV